jgi:glycosyltransferase involved in cell wall biosynthesis
VVVLVFGGLSERKGLQQLLAALCALGREDVHALLVGAADEDARRLLNGPAARRLQLGGRLHVIDRWVDDDMENMAFAAADIAWLGYSGHWRSSGVQVQSALSGLPMVACDEGLIGWLTERHQCGVVVPVQQEAAVVAALGRLASSPDLRRRMGERGREAFAQHSLENAGAVLSASLSRALGLQAAGS